MVEILSPLAPKLRSGTHGAQGLGGVKMGTRAIAGLWQIAGWQDFESAAKPVLNATGLTSFGDYRQVQQAKAVTAWRIAPDKLLLEGTGNLSGFATDTLVVLDLSHARTVITLSGVDARDALSTVIALDTRAAAFPPGTYLQTVMHQIGVLIQCIGEDSFEIFAPCTWAETLWDFLYVNSLSFGITVEGAP